MTKPRQGSIHPGLYGLRIDGLQDSSSRLHPAPSGWPLLTVRQRPRPRSEDPAPGVLRLGPQDGEAWLARGVKVELTREPARALFLTPDPLGDDALLHPYLALPALVVNYWLGRQVLHGGAFAHRDRAWALLGDRGAGKSSLLAALLLAGLPILSDDVLVIEDGRLFGGPPSVDLREDAATRLGGDALGVLGSRARWRLRPPPAPLSLALGGFITLEWDEGFALTPLSSAERLRLLVTSSEIALGPQTADSLLALMPVPAYRLRRARDLTELPTIVDQLLAGLDDA